MLQPIMPLRLSFNSVAQLSDKKFNFVVCAVAWDARVACVSHAATRRMQFLSAIQLVGVAVWCV